MIDVTIIMPTYNRETALEMTLVGFSKQTYLEFEIIIVNDGGNKEVKNIVDKYKNKLRIKYIYQKNMGRSVARNTALKCAEGKYIIFNDDDRIPAVDYVEKHRNLLKENENNVIVGHKRDIINTNDSTLPKFEIIQNRISDLMIKKCQPTFSMFELEKKFENILVEWCVGDSNDNITVADEYVYKDIENFELGWMFATTANLSYCRNGVEDVCFDESYVGWGIEDNDFAYQLYLRGRKVKYSDDAINYHILHKKNGNYIEEMMSNLEKMCIKYENLQVYLFKLYIKDIIYLDETHDLWKALANEYVQNIMFKILKTYN